MAAGIPNNVDLRDFGPVGTSDDGPTFQAAINSLTAGGVVQIPDGVYNVETPLLLPGVNLAQPAITITLRGQTAPSRIASVIGPIALPTQGAVLQCHRAGGPAILSGRPGDADGFSILTARLENLTFRVLSGPSPLLHGVDLSAAGACSLLDVVCDAGNYDADGAIPGATAVYGCILPPVNNGAWTEIRSLMVVGFPTGVKMGEHAHAWEISAWGCAVGVEVPDGAHAALIHRYLDCHNLNGLSFSGGARLDVSQWDIERTNARQFDLLDPHNYGQGSARWASVLAGLGAVNALSIRGGEGFVCTAIGGGGPLPPPTPPPLPNTWTVIDDGGPGYSRVGTGWQTWNGSGGYYANNADYTTAAGSGANTASWTFTGLTAGAAYAVAACWGGYAQHATNTPYAVTANGSTQAVVVNQQAASTGGPTLGGVTFTPLATATAGSDGVVTVAISDNANGWVIADAVAVSPA